MLNKGMVNKGMVCQSEIPAGLGKEQDHLMNKMCVKLFLSFFLLIPLSIIFVKVFLKNIIKSLEP